MNSKVDPKRCRIEPRQGARRGLAESYEWYVAGQAEEVQRSRRPIMQRWGEACPEWCVVRRVLPQAGGRRDFKAGVFPERAAEPPPG